MEEKGLAKPANSELSKKRKLSLHDDVASGRKAKLKALKEKSNIDNDDTGKSETVCNVKNTDGSHKDLKNEKENIVEVSDDESVTSKPIVECKQKESDEVKVIASLSVKRTKHKVDLKKSVEQNKKRRGRRKLVEEVKPKSVSIQDMFKQLECKRQKAKSNPSVEEITLSDDEGIPKESANNRSQCESSQSSNKSLSEDILDKSLDSGIVPSTLKKSKTKPTSMKFSMKMFCSKSSVQSDNKLDNCNIEGTDSKSAEMVKPSITSNLSQICNEKIDSDLKQSKISDITEEVVTGVSVDDCNGDDNSDEKSLEASEISDQLNDSIRQCNDTSDPDDVSTIPSKISSIPLDACTKDAKETIICANVKDVSASESIFGRSSPSNLRGPLNKRLTPKQMMRRRQLELQREEKRLKLNEEKERKEDEKKKVKEEKEQKKQEELRVKQIEKDEKEQKKQEEKEEKEKQKQEELLLKQKEKDEKLQKKNEEKQKREEEKKKKEEDTEMEKKRKEEEKHLAEEEEKKIKSKFAQFFVPKKGKSDITPIQCEERKGADQSFMNFRVKNNMRMCPLIRRSLDVKKKKIVR